MATTKKAAKKVEPVEEDGLDPKTEEKLDEVLGSEQAQKLPAPEEGEKALDVWRRMELEDERIILGELQGRTLDTMIYSFDQDGRTTTGFSWKGVREVVRTLNARGFTKIRQKPEIEPRMEEVKDPDGGTAIRCAVYAEDVLNGGGNWGVAMQPTKMRTSRGEVNDRFATAKALSKAQRNAFEPLIPLEAIEILKAQYLGRPDAVKTIPGAARLMEERPEPLDTPEAKEKIARMREIYDDIKALDRLVMPPGQFNSIVMGAQHDLDRMDDAIAHLETFAQTEEQIETIREEVRQTIPKEEFDKAAGKLGSMGVNQSRRLAFWEDLRRAKTREAP